MIARASSADIEELRWAFYLKAEDRLVDDFARLKEPVAPETIAQWIGHPLDDGLTPAEMTDLRARLEQMRGDATIPKRLDGTPRKRHTRPAAGPS